MSYNFDQLKDRRNSECTKWRVGENELPMSMADMDFETPAFITDAIKDRLEHSLFGYTVEPEDFLPSIMDWVRDHHQWDVKREWIRFIPGIVKGIGMVINVFTKEDEKVIIQPPVYHPFRLTLEGNGREVVFNPLKMREDGYYESFIGDYETQGVRILEDGSREYKDAYLFQKVYAGQKLLAYHEAKPGVDGYRIDGMVLRAVNGAEKRRIKGRGFHLLDDEKTYISDENGCASFRDTNLVVTHLLELETASNVMGDINYNGSVYIKGDAGGNIHVKATGDIVVEGFVENARLESERGVLIKKGANGNGEAQIIAAGTVMGRFGPHRYHLHPF